MRLQFCYKKSTPIAVSMEATIDTIQFQSIFGSGRTLKQLFVILKKKSFIQSREYFIIIQTDENCYFSRRKVLNLSLSFCNHTMASKRGKNIFNADLATSYPFLVQCTKNKTPSDVHCNMCGSDFNIAYAGKSNIEKHIATIKHRKAHILRASNQPLTQFVHRTDYSTAAFEGAWAYHVVNANNSFLSTDCTSELFRECFGMKNFHSARTKMEAIVKNIIAPVGETIVKEDLLNCNYVTSTTDASNHGNTKLMPVMVRYFKPTEGVRVKMLEFTSVPNETSDTISSLLISTAEQNNIAEKVAGFGGDNCNTNFGSVERSGENNVYHKLPGIYL